MASGSAKARNMVFPVKQHDLAFNNKELSDLTLVSKDGQKFYALLSLIQRRWLWFASRKNLEKARNVSEDDENVLEINITAKLLLLILRWVYFCEVDLTGWGFEDLSLLAEKCEEFCLPEIRDVALNRIKKYGASGQIKLSEMSPLFEYGMKTKDNFMMNRMVGIAVFQIEQIMKTKDFERFPPEFMAQIVNSIHESNYPKFFKSLLRWSRSRNWEHVNSVMTNVNWSMVPPEVISALTSQGALSSSEEVIAKVSAWNSSEKSPKAEDEVKMSTKGVGVGQTETHLKVDDVAEFPSDEANRNSTPTSLFSQNEFYESSGYLFLDLKKPEEGNTVSWTCKEGSVRSVYVNGSGAYRAPVGEANFVTFSVTSIKSVQMFTSKGTLINNLTVRFE